MTQYICRDLKLATVLAFAGYKLTRMVAEPDGSKTWLFQNPGDIELLAKDYENNIQAVSDVKSLLEIFEEQLQQAGSSAPKSPTITTPRGEKHELVKVEIETVPGRTWVTHDIPTATILSLRGYELLDIEMEGQSATFVFAHDSNLKNIIAQFNKRELLVEPHALDATGYELRKKLREQRGH